jgi:hypothetical protein
VLSELLSVKAAYSWVCRFQMARKGQAALKVLVIVNFVQVKQAGQYLK